MTDTSSILLVDDDADSLSVLASILAAVGYQVRTSDSGGLALSGGECPSVGRDRPKRADVRIRSFSNVCVC